MKPHRYNEGTCCEFQSRHPIHNVDDVLDLSPQTLTVAVAIENVRERLPVIVENLSRVNVDGDRKYLEFNLAQQIKSLAYLLQDLLLTNEQERTAGAMDSVTATLGEVGKQLYYNLTGEKEDEPDGTDGTDKKGARRRSS